MWRSGFLRISIAVLDIACFMVHNTSAIAIIDAALDESGLLLAVAASQQGIGHAIRRNITFYP